MGSSTSTYDQRVERPSDTDLLYAWRKGSTEAGERLCTRYYDAVVRFFATKVTEDLSDLVQESFKACVEGKDRIDESFRGYLFGAAYRILQRYFRRKYRAPEGELLSCSIRDLRPGPSTVLRGADEKHQLLSALQALPLEIQAALELTYWEELSSPEIAVALDIPASTVRSHLRRGRIMLERTMRGAES